jgi:hypothetical protein
MSPAYTLGVLFESGRLASPILPLEIKDVGYVSSCAQEAYGPVELSAVNRAGWWWVHNGRGDRIAEGPTEFHAWGRLLHELCRLEQLRATLWSVYGRDPGTESQHQGSADPSAEGEEGR